MKFLVGLSLFLLMAVTASAQTQYEIIQDKDSGKKILKGIISRDLLEKDASYDWYAENKDGYKPYPAALDALKKNVDSVQMIIFMGTWCGDSHFIIPKFFMLADAAGFSEKNISLIGVDREKKTLGNLTTTLNVLNVPTMIVLKNGKEIGRVVEYGKSGQFDKDLAEILAIPAGR
ncbi:MAG: thioredoxin [Chitinophagaceae bacterium]|nr:MAG: thioredoxin [Chitinophagaceae bacterium]